MSGTAGRTVRLVDVLRHREVAGLVSGQVLSDWGDQIARVALAMLILREYDSALLAALVFAVSYAPGMLGAALLGPLADRLPRREVLVACDVARGLLLVVLALLSVRGAPVLLLLAVLLVAQLIEAPFTSARRALLADLLPDPARYYAAEGLMRVLHQADQAVGFVLGGAVVALVGAESGLLLDAVSFGVSAVLVLALVRRRPAALNSSPGLRGFVAELAEGGRLVRHDARRRALLLVGWGSTVFLAAPEGAGLAYARAHGGGALAGGLLLAALPLGAAIGAAVILRRPPAEQLGLVLPLAVTGATVLLGAAVDPPVAVAVVLWAVSGACQGFMLTLIATLVMITPAEARGRVNGLASAGFATAGAASFALAGWLSDRTTPAFAVTLAGVLGLAVLGLAARAWPEAALRRAVLSAEARVAAGEPPARGSFEGDADADTAGAGVPAPAAVRQAAIAIPEPRTAAVTSSEPV
ncbi:MAG: MFS transporter [Motilibacteraceae bacterium]